MAYVMPDSTPGVGASAEVRLYAARGERESFQLCIRAGKNALERVALEGYALGRSIGPPEMRRLAYIELPEPSARAWSEERVRPGPLLDYQPLDIPAETTGVFWVSYTIPGDTPPGVYTGQIRVRPVNSRVFPVEVAIEVFDFDMPEIPSLRVLAPLERSVIRTFYGIDDAPLESWRPIYDAFADSRLSLSLWQDGSLVRFPGIVPVDAPEVKELGAAPPDTQILKEHLAYAVDAMHMNTINLADSTYGVTPFQPTKEALEQDPLQLYLHDMADWLDAHGWLERAVALTSPTPTRDEWQKVRDGYFRVNRADARIKRLMLGEPHPHFERYTNIWAITLRSWLPQACALLRNGISLATPVEAPARYIDASESGPASPNALFVTAPEDAYDGSLFSAWCSSQPPTSATPATLRLDLETGVQTQWIVVHWLPGHEADEIQVNTSHGYGMFSKAAIKWDHKLPANRYDTSLSIGRFKLVKTFEAIRLTFRHTRRNVPVGVAEIEFTQTPASAVPEHIEPIDTWLYPIKGDFPSLAADAHPAEARLFGWVCWGTGMKGLALESLNQWPREWADVFRDGPSVWTGAGQGEGVLYYPGPQGPIASVTMERLRDGIEDYEYFAAMDRAVREGIVNNVEVRKWLSPRHFECNTSENEVEKLGDELANMRVKIGRALTKSLKQTPPSESDSEPGKQEVEAHTPVDSEKPSEQDKKE